MQFSYLQRNKTAALEHKYKIIPNLGSHDFLRNKNPGRSVQRSRQLHSTCRLWVTVTKRSRATDPPRDEPGLQQRCRTAGSSGTGRGHTGRCPRARRASRARPGRARRRSGRGAEPPRPAQAAASPGAQGPPFGPSHRGRRRRPGALRDSPGPPPATEGEAAAFGGQRPSPPRHATHSPTAAEPEVRALSSTGTDTQSRGCTPLRPRAAPSGPGGRVASHHPCLSPAPR